MSITHSNRRSTGLKLGLLSAAAALMFGGANVVQADAYSDAVLATDGLLAYYRMTETSGTTAENEVTTSGVGDATYKGTSHIAYNQQPGPFTGSTAVGVNAGIARTGTSTNFGFLDVNTSDGTEDGTLWNNDYSAEVWFKPQLAFGEAQIQYIFTRTNAEPGDGQGQGSALLGEGFGIRGNIEENEADRGRFFFTNNGVSLDENGEVPEEPLPRSIKSENILTLGNWYHAVMTREGNTLKLYINELIVDEDTGEITRGFSEMISNTGASLGTAEGSRHAAFGARRDNLAPLAFEGEIAEVAIYNGALSEEQVMAHFNTVIPEPGSLLLLGAGATMLLYRRRTVS